MSDASRIPSVVVAAVIGLSLTAALAWCRAVGILGPAFSIVLVFTTTWAATLGAVASVRMIQRSRTRDNATHVVGLHVRLRTPAWMLLTPSFHVLGVGSLVAALTTLLGARLVGALIFSLSGAMAFAVGFALARTGVTSVELREDGMYAYAGEARVFIRWGDIAQVRRVGGNILVIELNDPEIVRRSIEPDTRQARRRFNPPTMTKLGLLLRPWTGGVATFTLERAIMSALKGADYDSANNVS
jgi:hypothetical protein